LTKLSLSVCVETRWGGLMLAVYIYMKGVAYENLQKRVRQD
jgi:hypothetical protein